MSHQTEGPSDRPYRSHLRPACLACRRRKSRCKARDGSDICAMCQVHDTSCIFPRISASRRGLTTPSRQAAEVPRYRETSYIPQDSLDENLVVNVLADSTQHSDVSCYPQELPNFSEHQSDRVTTPVISNDGVSPRRSAFPSASVITAGATITSHVIGPASADDSDALERYLLTITNSGGRPVVRTSPSTWAPTRLTRPVLFNTVLSRPLGTSKAQSIAPQKCEIIEKFLEPNSKDLVNL
jgi:hypothetical protein